MSQSHIRKRNLNAGSGTAAPSYQQAMESLRLVFHALKDNRLLFVWLILWLSNRLDNTLDITKVRLLARRTSNQLPTSAWAVRTVYDGTVSWVEFSHPVPGEPRRYLWLPVPACLNQFCQAVLSEAEYETPLLNETQAQQLVDFVHKKLRPRAIKFKGKPRLDKRIWHRFWLKCALANATLDVPAIELVFGPSALHHRHALAYTSQAHSAIRAQWFALQNRIFERIIGAARHLSCDADFNRVVAGRAMAIDPSPPLAKYLSAYPNKIVAIVMNPGREEIPDEHFGGKRCVDLTALPSVFATIQANTDSLKPERGSLSKAQLLRYHNAWTCQLALQTIALTSMRPTGAVSPTAESVCGDTAAVKDKGTWRRLYLNLFLQKELAKYQAFAKQLMPSFRFDTDKPLFYLLDEDFAGTPLTARVLRRFLATFWPGHVPYQLRHACAQSLALRKLPTHLIARVMGHYLDGEQVEITLADRHSKQQILVALNGLTADLGIRGAS
ncbi:hypothetical protein [uncultured Ferrimonas sp.]|uniref:hypothetical protein n=1 Tax=uncultured Ferrimonas sp. TaxID=432640 RepID=UPI00260791A8|nr:hypothetical protein [uncultured Ferrimonas sp.]